MKLFFPVKYKKIIRLNSKSKTTFVKEHQINTLFYSYINDIRGIIIYWLKLLIMIFLILRNNIRENKK